jgi:hypothetical protein
MWSCCPVLGHGSDNVTRSQSPDNRNNWLSFETIIVIALACIIYRVCWSNHLTKQSGCLKGWIYIPVSYTSLYRYRNSCPLGAIQILLLLLLLFVKGIKPSVSGLCWDTKTLSGVAKITSKPSTNTSGFDYILAPPSRVLVSRHRPSASGLIP